MGKVYIAKELRFHGEDLRKIKIFEVKGLNEIFSCDATPLNGIVLIPSSIVSIYKSNEDQQTISQFLPKLKNINQNKILFRIGQPNNATLLDIYSINPEIYAVNSSDIENCP